MNKARITYRLDNQPDGDRERTRKRGRHAVIPLHQEEFQVVEETPDRLNQYTSDFGTWKSPFDEETERIERLIRETTERRQPDWDNEPKGNPPSPIIEEEPRREREESLRGSYSPPYEEQPVITTTRYVRYSKPPWLKIVSAVAAAVATGVLLGFFVLSMLGGKVSPQEIGTGGQISPDSAASVSGTEGGEDAGTIGASGNTQNGMTEAVSQSAVSGVDIHIAAKTLSILQNGIFSTAEGAQTAQEELRRQGLAGAIEQSDRHYVYAGIAADRNDALNLSKELQSRQIEIYVKNYSLPALTKVNWPGSTEILENYLTQSDQLVQIISGMTAVHLEEATPTPMDEKSMQSLKERHEVWSTAASNVSREAPEEAKPILQKLDQAMNTAIQSIDEYKKNPAGSMLWEAQTSLMNFVLAEKELLEKIAVK
ncbi:SPOR domain-containing protein [Paenibacillus sp. J2TS4]|uniref:SPOR domain-containing protein n=1 Tax=Paenibacillus sp. J2TS4 TaxID=2807194 RepID=UPI001B2F8353|nr:SPOR domain-containing protein [Paenibacillus sp. J2TS4]GIP31359.1 hypothetical protein J2TS4_05690 [Paenibacillus sp. J2TS4]